jgi:tungstate transport system permease protein
MPDDVSALQLPLTGDPALLAIVRLSLIVSLSAVVFGALIGVPFGAAVALTRFPGREAVIVILNALMGFPPVVVGLAIYPPAVALRAARIVGPDECGDGASTRSRK